jgi:hypothetical protein
VMTELGFADQEKFASRMGKLLAPGIAEQVAEMRDGFLIGHELREYVTAVSEEGA